jgi:hypothetical protein
VVLSGTPFVKLGGGFNDLYDEEDEEDEFSDEEPERKEEPAGA